MYRLITSFTLWLNSVVLAGILLGQLWAHINMICEVKGIRCFTVRCALHFWVSYMPIWWKIYDYKHLIVPHIVTSNWFLHKNMKGISYKEVRFYEAVYSTEKVAKHVICCVISKMCKFIYIFVIEHLIQLQKKYVLSTAIPVLSVIKLIWSRYDENK